MVRLIGDGPWSRSRAVFRSFHFLPFRRDGDFGSEFDVFSMAGVAHRDRAEEPFVSEFRKLHME